MLLSITNFLETRLHLKVNRHKSMVARPWERKFLGYSFTAHKECKIRMAQKSLKRFRKHLKELFRDISLSSGPPHSSQTVLGSSLMVCQYSRTSLHFWHWYS